MTNPTERRKKAHSNTRAAVDLVSNLGAVMDYADSLIMGVADKLWGSDKHALALELIAASAHIRNALSDDQAERVAFLEHFPHLCRKDS